jgi:hypothetical protein
MQGRNRHFCLTLALARHKYFLLLISTSGKKAACQPNRRAAPDAFSMPKPKRGLAFSRRGPRIYQTARAHDPRTTKKLQ